MGMMFESRIDAALYDVMRRLAELERKVAELEKRPAARKSGAK